MTGSNEIHWREERMAGDTVLRAELGATHLLFALGPALVGPSKTDRMNLVLDVLRPELRAVRWCEQIHGRLVASLGEEPGEPFRGVTSVGRCDGLITADAYVGLTVWTADCVPVLITGGEVIAAAHAGWRGAAADIVGTIVRRFEIEYGIEAGRLHAFLGPAISGARYPVGTEVIDALRARLPDDSLWRVGAQVDLREFLSARLEGLGVPPSAIAKVGPCTATTQHLASFRRDGVMAGRQWAMVYRAREV
jgi:YfiH family protein